MERPYQRPVPGPREVRTPHHPGGGGADAAGARAHTHERDTRGLPEVGMQVRIRTNSLEFEFAPNSHEFVDPSEFEFATSNSNSPLIRLISPEA